jgi:hypothetical protein
MTTKKIKKAVLTTTKKNKKAKLKSQKKEKTSSNTASTHMQPQKPTHKSPTRLHVADATVP